MIYPIVLYGDPVLKKPAENLTPGEEVTELAKSLFETMYAASGVGLAAPQVGISKRIFVVDSTPMEEAETEGLRQIFINPTIVDRKGEIWAFEEGCLSIPGIREDVRREPEITLNYFDESWVKHTSTFEGIHARIIQHEYDHIEGVLFTDHISPLKKRLIKGKLTNITKGKVDVDYRVKVAVKR